MALVEGTNCGFVTTAPSGDPAGAAAGSVDNMTYAARYTSPSDAVKVTEIGWYTITASEEANFEVGIYDDNTDAPGDLLSGSDKTNAKGTDAGWKRVTGLNITISPSTVYWIAVALENTATATQMEVTSDASYKRNFLSGTTTLPDPSWSGGAAATRIVPYYAVYETAATGTNTQINIGDTWKAVAGMQINIGDAWKAVAGAQVNIGDTWKPIF